MLVPTQSHANKVMLKSLQARLQQHVNRELPDVQAGFRKGRGTRGQIANMCWIIEKAKEFQNLLWVVGNLDLESRPAGFPGGMVGSQQACMPGPRHEEETPFCSTDSRAQGCGNCWEAWDSARLLSGLPSCGFRPRSQPTSALCVQPVLVPQ